MSVITESLSKELIDSVKNSKSYTLLHTLSTKYGIDHNAIISLYIASGRNQFRRGNAYYSRNPNALNGIIIEFLNNENVQMHFLAQRYLTSPTVLVQAILSHVFSLDNINGKVKKAILNEFFDCPDFLFNFAQNFEQFFETNKINSPNFTFTKNDLNCEFPDELPASTPPNTSDSEALQNSQEKNSQNNSNFQNPQNQPKFPLEKITPTLLSRLYNSIWIALLFGDNQSVQVAKLRQKIGKLYEEKLEKNIQDSFPQTPYLNDEQLRLQVRTKTPDILFPLPVCVEKWFFRWIDSKMIFASQSAQSEVRKQIQGYEFRWDLGVCIFWAGVAVYPNQVINLVRNVWKDNFFTKIPISRRKKIFLDKLKNAKSVIGMAKIFDERAGLGDGMVKVMRGELGNGDGVKCNPNLGEKKTKIDYQNYNIDFSSIHIPQYFPHISPTQSIDITSDCVDPFQTALIQDSIEHGSTRSDYGSKEPPNTPYPLSPPAKQAKLIDTNPVWSNFDNDVGLDAISVPNRNLQNQENLSKSLSVPQSTSTSQTLNTLDKYHYSELPPPLYPIHHMNPNCHLVKNRYIVGREKNKSNPKNDKNCDFSSNTPNTTQIPATHHTPFLYHSDTHQLPLQLRKSPQLLDNSNKNPEKRIRNCSKSVNVPPYLKIPPSLSMLIIESVAVVSGMDCLGVEFGPEKENFEVKSVGKSDQNIIPPVKDQSVDEFMANLIGNGNSKLNCDWNPCQTYYFMESHDVRDLGQKSDQSQTINNHSNEQNIDHCDDSLPFTLPTPFDPPPSLSDLLNYKNETLLSHFPQITSSISLLTRPTHLPPPPNQPIPSCVCQISDTIAFNQQTIDLVKYDKELSEYLLSKNEFNLINFDAKITKNDFGHNYNVNNIDNYLDFAAMNPNNVHYLNYEAKLREDAFIESLLRQHFQLSGYFEFQMFQE